uniref:asparagine--tRNA ligase n=1 Tax=Dermatophagoides pteronyssinus TaxID=6956 RepID=A0A6P6Y593_DERPT
PLSKNAPTLNTLRSMQHLRPRFAVCAAVFRIRSQLAFATHQFFQGRGFQYVHTPIITAADCEGAGQMFQVTTLLPEGLQAAKLPATEQGAGGYSKDFFGKPVSLTVSGQLAVENFCHALCDVYTFGPTFRAEISHTSRHLAEFWMIEPEMAFAELEDNMECAEAFVKFCVQFLLDRAHSDLEFLDAKVERGLLERLQNIVSSSFARITYTEAVELLRAQKEVAFELEPVWGDDLCSAHERYLSEVVFKKPVIVTDYPYALKAFYMKLNPGGKTVRAMDVLVPKIGELIGGSQREENLELLLKQMEDKHIDKAELEWYLDLRKFGTVPHSGFGLGFERLVMLCTGIENIRDVIPYPRYVGNALF